MIFREKLGDKEAEALVYFVEEKLKESNELNQNILSTKKGKPELVSKKGISTTNMIKWFFAFFMTMFALLIIGLYFKK